MAGKRGGAERGGQHTFCTAHVPQGGIVVSPRERSEAQRILYRWYGTQRFDESKVKLFAFLRRLNPTGRISENMWAALLFVRFVSKKRASIVARESIDVQHPRFKTWEPVVEISRSVSHEYWLVPKTTIDLKAPDKAGRCSLLSLVRRNFSGIVCCVVNLSDVLAQADLRDFLITPDEVEDPAAMDFDVHYVFAITAPTWKLGKHVAKFTARTKAAQVLVLCWLLCHCCNVFGLNWAGSSHFRVR